MSTNKPEKLQPPYPGGDPVVGKATVDIGLPTNIEPRATSRSEQRT